MIIDGCCTVSSRREYEIATSNLLKEMDKHDISKTVLFCDDRCAAVKNEDGNNFVDNIFQKNKDRYYRFATANPWNGDVAAQEIEKRLASGFNGVFFNSLVQGFTINDDIVLPLIEVCEKYCVPVYFNTGTPIQAMPFQVLSLAKRYPKVNFIVGHMGANDYLGDAYSAAELVDNIYLDSSLNLTCSMRNAAKLFSNKMIFGSAYPRSSYFIELKRLRQGVKDEEVLGNILSQNLLSILGGKK